MIRSMTQDALDMAQEILANPELLRQAENSPEALAAQEHLAMRRDLTRMSMNIAGFLHDQVMAAAPAKVETPPEQPAPQPAVPDPAVIATAIAFSRVAKTVRQCMALQVRFADNQRKHDRTGQELIGQVITASRQGVLVEKRRQLKRAVTETIEADRDAEAIQRHEAENLLADLDDRLDDELLRGDLEEQPLGVCVAKLCKRLGVTPDWNDWRDTAWAAEEIARKPAGSPYANEGWQTPVKREPPPAADQPVSPTGLPTMGLRHSPSDPKGFYPLPSSPGLPR
jgi:hypothetical protein